MFKSILIVIDVSGSDLEDQSGQEPPPNNQQSKYQLKIEKFCLKSFLEAVVGREQKFERIFKTIINN